MTTQRLEDRILNARRLRDALWVICETDAEKQAFVDWIVAHRPDVLLTFTQGACTHSAYAYLSEFYWGQDGIIDRMVDADRLNPYWMRMSFADWYNEMGFTIEDDDVDCNLDDLL